MYIFAIGSARVHIGRTFSNGMTEARIAAPVALPSTTGFWHLRHPDTYGEVGIAAWAVAWAAFYLQCPALHDKHDPTWMPGRVDANAVFRGLPSDVRESLNRLSSQVVRSRDKPFNAAVRCLRENLERVE